MKKEVIPYGRQDISQDDIDSVIDVLNSDFLTQGPKVPEFEEAISKKVGAKHAFAMNSATSALHVACMALELGPGDYLWTSPVTFVASANCALYCGANVDFVDIDPNSFNLCPNQLEEKLIIAKKNNRLPKIIVAVHLCGQSADMEKIYALANRYKFKLIEDASHAIGGKYKNEYIGNCKYSDITVFSFHPVKIITTCEGGMALTNSDDLSSKIEILRNHGITKDPKLMNKKSEGPWYYQQLALGYNYRMTDVQAALGLSQLERLDNYVAIRHELANRYNELLKELPVKTPKLHEGCYSSYHLYVIRLKLDSIFISHQEVFENLRANNILVNIHYIPVHLQPFYVNLGFSKGDFPKSEKYYEEAISLPLYPGLSYENQDYVVSTLKKIFKA
tara:strand:+ start:4666 stop:5838 length:1173 start_codon:yes stop_codon:yes gene_type:complete